MGMSASQARLLSITSRMNDIEFKSQQVANTKIRLADDSERVANDYTKALNKQKFTFTSYASGFAKKENLTFNSLYKPNCPYILKNSKGQTVIPSSLYKMYNAVVSDSNDPNGHANRATQGALFNPSENGDYFNAFMGAKYGDVTVWADRVLAAAGKGNLTWHNNYSEVTAEFNGNGGGLGTWQAIAQYAVDHNVTVPGLPTVEEANYYEALFKDFTSNAETTVATSTKGGYHTYAMITEDNMDNFVEIPSNSSISGNANWLYEAIESGEFMLVSVDTGKQVSVSGEIGLTQETDTTELAKAEAKYNAETAKINKKEKILDNEMKALDTEHQALKTEMDSIKSLIKDNVDKSFNIFS